MTSNRIKNIHKRKEVSGAADDRCSHVDPDDNDDDKDEEPLVINFSEVLDEDPSFGSDINDDLKIIYPDLIKIYKESSNCDLIRMAIINLEDDKKIKTIPFKKISKMFKKNITKFNENKLNDSEKMLEAIKNIETIEDATDFVTNFSSMSNLKLDYQSTINDFIYSIVKTFASYFVLSENYFKEILPEYHLAATIYVQIFMNLFRDKNYIVRCNERHYANHARRNLHLDEVRSKNPLFPDIKLIYRKSNMEMIVVEHQKRKSTEDRKKEKKDTTKICVLMHDQLTKLSKELEKSGKGDLIKEVNVYGIITSKFEIDIYVMSIPAPELYLFYRIYSFELPEDLNNIYLLHGALRNFVDFRKIIDENYRRYNSIIMGEPLTPTNRQWSVKIKISPISLNEEKKKLKKKN